MERSSQQLYRLSMALISRRWPSRPPAELTKQCQHLEDCSKAEEEQGLQLALLKDRVETAEQKVATRRAEIHAQMMAVREELVEHAPVNPAHQRRLHDRILTLERSYAEVAIDDTAARELSQQRPRLQELRSEIQRSRRELAALVRKLCVQDAKSRADATIKAACDALDKAVREFDNLCSSMTVLLERFASLAEPR
jgi:chromosome segregation ATPase